MNWGTIILALLLMTSVVGAEVLELPSQASFYERPVELSFKARNDSAQTQAVTVDLQVVKFTVLASPGTLNAGETGEVKLRLQPRNDLIGSTYNATLTVRVGAQETRKEIRLSFEKAKQAMNKEPEKPAPPRAGFPLAGFVVLPSLGVFNGAILNIALAVIAALLLISFIARFTKRIMQK